MTTILKIPKCEVVTLFLKDLNDINSFPRYPQHSTSSPLDSVPWLDRLKNSQLWWAFLGTELHSKHEREHRGPNRIFTIWIPSHIRKRKKNYFDYQLQKLGKSGSTAPQSFSSLAPLQTLQPHFHKLPSTKKRSLQPSEMFDSHDSHCCKYT